MEEGQNYNKPDRGTVIKVEPIRSLGAISKIKNLLACKPRNFCFFTIGINTPMLVSTLLSLKVNQVQELWPHGKIRLGNEKADRIILNRACIKSIGKLLSKKSYEPTDHLFLSQKGDVLTLPSVNRLVKQWCRKAGLQGNYSEFRGHLT